jgi:hypothetical protein
MVNIWIRPLKVAACAVLLLSPHSFSQTDRPKAYLKEATISESAGKVQIISNSPRPLAQILDALRQKYGWPVNYEDPRFDSKMDVVETKKPGIATDSNLPSLLPAGGAFTIEFSSSAPSEEKILQSAVESYNRGNYPGRFEVRSGKPGAYSIVGVKARDARDQITGQSPLFDEPVSLASQQRMALDTINLICQAIAEQRGVAVTLGVFPRRVLAAAPVVLGGVKVPARDLLYQTLSNINRPFYWRLLYDPSTHGYFLDIHLLAVTKKP